METINGEEISFEDVKKDGFDYIKISAIDEDEIIREVLNLELAWKLLRDYAEIVEIKIIQNLICCSPKKENWDL